MDLWTLLEWLAWAASAAFAWLILSDWLRTDATYSEDQLLSSREGELEALTEQHHLGGGLTQDGRHD